MRAKEWLALQFHDPQTQSGIVMAFCGADVKTRRRLLALQGISVAKDYNVEEWGGSQVSKKYSGTELRDLGIEVLATEGNTAIVLSYGPKP